MGAFTEFADEARHRGPEFPILEPTEPPPHPDTTASVETSSHDRRVFVIRFSLLLGLRSAQTRGLLGVLAIHHSSRITAWSRRQLLAAFSYSDAAEHRFSGEVLAVDANLVTLHARGYYSE